MKRISLSLLVSYQLLKPNYTCLQFSCVSACSWGGSSRSHLIKIVGLCFRSHFFYLFSEIDDLSLVFLHFPLLGFVLSHQLIFFFGPIISLLVMLLHTHIQHAYLVIELLGLASEISVLLL